MIWVDHSAPTNSPIDHRCIVGDGAPAESSLIGIFMHKDQSEVEGMAWEPEENETLFSM